MFKSIKTAILATLIVLVLPYAAFASNDSLDKKLVKKLLEKGVPQSYIDENKDKVSMLQNMADFNGRFIKSEKTTFIVDEKTGELKPLDKEDVVPQGVIDPSLLSLSVTTWERYDSYANRYDKYSFFADWDWSRMPSYVLVDLFGISWSDDFTIQYITGKNEWYNGTYGWQSETLDQTDCYEIDNEAGFCFAIDLLAQASDQRGWGRADVYHGTNETGSANIATDYWHKKVVPGIPTVTIGRPGITLSTTTNWDHAVRFTDITY